MASGEIDIVRTAALFILRHGTAAPDAARRTYEALAKAGYQTSPAIATRVLEAIARQTPAASPISDPG